MLAKLESVLYVLFVYALYLVIAPIKLVIDLLKRKPKVFVEFKTSTKKYFKNALGFKSFKTAFGRGK